VGGVGTTTQLGRSTCVANVVTSESPVSVLLVEDDPLIREFVVEALRDAGYHVIHASTGKRRWTGASATSRTC
jgi:response regulator RpfG family c-di-GMP phosphodiesterase